MSDSWRLTPEERAVLTPAERDRLAELESAQARGTLSKTGLDEKWLLERRGLADYLWSVGQRDLVGALDAAERFRVGDRNDQRLAVLLESYPQLKSNDLVGLAERFRAGYVDRSILVDWQLFGWGSVIGMGLLTRVDLAELHGLRDRLAEELQGLLASVARQAATPDVESPPAAAGDEKPAGITPEESASTSDPLLTEEGQQESPVTLGQQLTALRKEAKLTVDELAEHMKMNRSNVLDHLQDKSIPRRKNVQQYEALFTAMLQRPVKLKR